jgi:hypothetical protein
LKEYIDSIKLRTYKSMGRKKNTENGYLSGIDKKITKILVWQLGLAILKKWGT